ncbi:MAG: prephenate dehydrogenase/arogenate dehydrogenase family protein [Patescibacteria group bacterium]
METVSIIGHGRFGKVLEKILRTDFNVLIHDRYSPKSVTAEKAWQAKIIFMAVPISKFEESLKGNLKYLRTGQTIIDTLSVKSHPDKILKKYLKGKGINVILSHPLFGPDSFSAKSKGLSIVMWPSLGSKKEYKFWKDFFQVKGFTVVELSPKNHDRLAAYSQGLTHFVGRLLEAIHFKPTAIDTLGAKKLHEIMQQTCNDSWKLFQDLQTYNPYTKQMRLDLGVAYKKIYGQLLPSNLGLPIYGIQGGKGSFSEQALTSYTQAENIKHFKIKYLFTSEKVLNELNKGGIDFGVFAIANGTGGLVEESMQAIAKYSFEVENNIPIFVRHCLMRRKDAKGSIKTIMAHEQVFMQCKNTLRRKYPRTKLATGVGAMIDTAKVAETLRSGKLSKNVAILGPKILAEMYDFEILDQDLQDNKKNTTTFLIVRR